MKCSLILATLGRDTELKALLESLSRQTYRDFELIVVDQNQDGKVDAILEQFSGSFPIHQKKVQFTGNARARDYGIQFAKGEIVAFPDDDCVYEDDVLERVVAQFRERAPLGILVGASYDFSKTAFSIGVETETPCYFSKYAMMGVEFTHFFNLDIIDRKLFYLDHDFGIGSKYPGGEGFELLYRLLRENYKAFYTPDIKIYHVNKDLGPGGVARVYRHSIGVGAYIRKFTNEPDYFMGYYIFRKMLVAPVLKMLWGACQGNPRKVLHSYNNLIGVWRGFLSYGR